MLLLLFLSLIGTDGEPFDFIGFHKFTLTIKKCLESVPEVSITTVVMLLVNVESLQIGGFDIHKL